MERPESSILHAIPDEDDGEGVTKRRLLDAAEHLFAERGFAGTSLRAVTESAGTSVSAANYHFGSKQALLRAALLRRVAPVNRARLAGLDALEAEAGDEPPAVEAVLEVFLRPALEMRSDAPERVARIRQVAARLYSDPPDLVAGLARDLFQPVHERFVDALARALPERPRQEVEVAYHFTVGVLVHLISGHLDSSMEGDPDALADCEALLQRLVRYSAAGLRAEAEPQPGIQPARLHGVKS
jgi:AcrR family transcriptional regulator